MNILDRLALFPLVISFVIYPLIAWPVLRFSTRAYRVPLFAAVNAAGMLMLILSQTIDGVPPTIPVFTLYLELTAGLFLAYVAFVAASYAALRWGVLAGERRAWIAFAIPLLFLALVKYCPAGWEPFHGALTTVGSKHVAGFFVGLSYMAFRLSYLVQEVRNGISEIPTAAEYLAFAFFVPAVSIGPISPYSKMKRSLEQWGECAPPSYQAGLRILVGLTKYIFLASLLNQFTYAGLLLDGHPHRKIDLLIAMPAYALYLYCNFSGFCDMVIGVSGLMRIEVNENFDRPFLARNLQEFWNRWHVTLSTWFREMMFTPMLKQLVRLNGPKSMTNMVPVTVLCVFLVLGIWHGTGINYALFGVAQGIGIATVYYYNLLLKRILSKQAYLAYQRNRALRVVAVSFTFAYFSASLFLFANSIDDMRRIAAALI